MSKDTSEAAFPINGACSDNQYNGMTLRDYFAAKAMQGIMQMIAGGAHAVSATRPEEELAQQAYAQADAMLKAREA